jgi:hypothetical protein
LKDTIVAAEQSFTPLTQVTKSETDVTPLGGHGARAPQRRYTPPADDDAPLDLVEEAIVRALVPIIVARIREELKSEAAQGRAALRTP